MKPSTSHLVYWKKLLAIHISEGGIKGRVWEQGIKIIFSKNREQKLKFPEIRERDISTQCNAAASRSHSSSVAWVQYREQEAEERR